MVSDSYKEVFVEHWFDLISTQFDCVSYSVALFIACQFALESDYGRSAIAKENDNFGGMKLPQSRPTTAMDKHRGHAVYDSPLSFLFDYFLCMSYARVTQNDLQDVEAFKTRLVNMRYCPSENYIGSIDKIYQKYYHLLNY